MHIEVIWCGSLFSSTVRKLFHDKALPLVVIIVVVLFCFSIFYVAQAGLRLEILLQLPVKT